MLQPGSAQGHGPSRSGVEASSHSTPANGISASVDGPAAQHCQERDLFVIINLAVGTCQAIILPASLPASDWSPRRWSRDFDRC